MDLNPELSKEHCWEPYLNHDPKRDEMSDSGSLKLGMLSAVMEKFVTRFQ